MEGTRTRIIAALLLSVVILGQSFGGVSAAAQRRHYRDQRRANGALIGKYSGIERRT